MADEAPSSSGSKAKRRKISAMSLAELNQAIEKAHTHMGAADYSHYVQTLIRQRELAKNTSSKK